MTKKTIFLALAAFISTNTIAHNKQTLAHNKDFLNARKAIITRLTQISLLPVIVKFKTEIEALEKLSTDTSLSQKEQSAVFAHLGVLYAFAENITKAQEALTTACKLSNNPCAQYNQAALHLLKAHTIHLEAVAYIEECEKQQNKKFFIKRWGQGASIFLKSLSMHYNLYKTGTTLHKMAMQTKDSGAFYELALIGEDRRICTAQLGIKKPHYYHELFSCTQHPIALYFTAKQHAEDNNMATCIQLMHYIVSLKCGESLHAIEFLSYYYAKAAEYFEEKNKFQEAQQCEQQIDKLSELWDYAQPYCSCDNKKLCSRFVSIATLEGWDNHLCPMLDRDLTEQDTRALLQAL